MPKDKSNKGLEALRGELREIDDKIIGLVIKRMNIVRDIGAVKRASGTAIRDSERENFNRERGKEVASGALPGELVDELTDLLAKWARDLQEKAK